MAVLLKYVIVLFFIIGILFMYTCFFPTRLFGENTFLFKGLVNPWFTVLWPILLHLEHAFQIDIGFLVF